MLFDNGKQMRDEVMLRDDQRFSEQCSAFCTPDIEGIAKSCEIGKRHIIFRAGQRVGKPCPVDVQRHAVCPADFADCAQLIKRVERAEFRRL